MDREECSKQNQSHNDDTSPDTQSSGSEKITTIRVFGVDMSKTVNPKENSRVNHSPETKPKRGNQRIVDGRVLSNKNQAAETNLCNTQSGSEEITIIRIFGVDISQAAGPINTDPLFPLSSAGTAGNVSVSEHGRVNPLPVRKRSQETNPKTGAGPGPKSKKRKTPVNPCDTVFFDTVKTLLSTGLLDGVPVKYISQTREITLQGTINRTGYQCTCSTCKNSKTINAYEFELHAGCRTNHPTQHIYFKTGKSIYDVVHKILNGTPQEKLFEVIQTATGSAVNQQKFDAWLGKSLDASSSEAPRIEGKKDVAPSS